MLGSGPLANARPRTWSKQAHELWPPLGRTDPGSAVQPPVSASRARIHGDRSFDAGAEHWVDDRGLHAGRSAPAASVASQIPRTALQHFGAREEPRPQPFVLFPPLLRALARLGPALPESDCCVNRFVVRPHPDRRRRHGTRARRDCLRKLSMSSASAPRQAGSTTRFGRNGSLRPSR